MNVNDIIVRRELIFMNAQELHALLEPLKPEIAKACQKPLDEMSITDKVRVANLLLAFYKLAE